MPLPAVAFITFIIAKGLRVGISLTLMDGEIDKIRQTLHYVTGTKYLRRNALTKRLLQYILCFVTIFTAPQNIAAPIPEPEQKQAPTTTSSTLLKSTGSHNYTANLAAGTEAGRAWLILLDKNDFGSAWEKASVLVREHVTKANFINNAEQVRKRLGKLISRELVISQYKTSLPGAPEGEYVILRFESNFEHKKKITEMVTPQKDPDGIWRVAGYYVR